MKKYLQEIKSVLLLSAVLLVICGVIYPLVVTGISQVAFPSQANGSLIEIEGKKIGSKLVGQAFTSPEFLVGRPSAVNYNVYTQVEKDEGMYSGVASGSDNLAASNPKLVARVKADMATFLDDNPSVTAAELPGDLLTASGSGLDPHLSPAAAELQVPRIVLNTGLSEAQIKKIISANTSDKLLGIFGEETVNVLGVNVAIASMLK